MRPAVDRNVFVANGHFPTVVDFGSEDSWTANEKDRDQAMGNPLAHRR
jgi:hypothetical protein